MRQLTTQGDCWNLDSNFVHHHYFAFNHAYHDDAGGRHSGNDADWVALVDGNNITGDPNFSDPGNGEFVILNAAVLYAGLLDVDGNSSMMGAIQKRMTPTGQPIAAGHGPSIGSPLTGAF